MLIAPSEMIFNIADLHRPQLTIQIIDSTRDSIIGQNCIFNAIKKKSKRQFLKFQYWRPKFSHISMEAIQLSLMLPHNTRGAYFKSLVSG